MIVIIFPFQTGAMEEISKISRERGGEFISKEVRVALAEERGQVRERFGFLMNCFGDWFLCLIYSKFGSYNDHFIYIFLRNWFSIGLFLPFAHARTHLYTHKHRRKVIDTNTRLYARQNRQKMTRTGTHTHANM